MSKQNPFQRYRQLDPKVGDLIEIENEAQVKWVIYVGNNSVVHLEPMVNHHNALLGKAKVRKSLVMDLLPDDGLMRVNNREDDAKDRGKTPLPLEDIVHNVIAQVWMNVDVPFDEKFKNSEYYATLWKYGEGWCTQVRE